MDKTQKKTCTTKRTTTHFLCCFGFSGEKKSLKIVKSNSKRRKSWFSWLKKSGTKTVPVDSATSEKIQTNKIYDLRSKPVLNKVSSKRQNTVITDHKTPPPQPLVAGEIMSDQASKERRQETRYGSEENTILGNEKHSKHVDPPKNDMCQKQRLSFRRKIDAIRAGRSQHGSSDTKTMSDQTIPIRRSTSFPTSVLEQAVANSPAKTLVTRRKSRKENNATRNNIDPIVGMSIIAVTLIIMLLWGRLCAILCMCAWFYVVPSLRTKVNDDSIVENNGVLGEPDFNSPQYKKKVVLDGFLERNHRSTAI